MNKMTYILQAFLILAVLVFSSCEHKELCDDHSHTAGLHVVFDWVHAPDAKPETMRLYLSLWMAARRRPTNSRITGEDILTYRQAVIGPCVSIRTRSPFFTAT